MRDCKLYMTILALSLLLGLGVFAAVPNQAVAGPSDCGNFPCQAFYCCEGRGRCAAEYHEYGICLSEAPFCTTVCSFDFIACRSDGGCP